MIMQRQRALGTLCLVGSLAAFVAAFQNCAPSGTQFEASDSSPSTALSAGSDRMHALVHPKFTAAAGPCQNLISPNDADAAMAQKTELMVTADENGSAACMISSVQNVSTGSETAICSASPANLAILHAGSGQGPDEFADPMGTMSGGSFGFIRTTASGAIAFVFVGAEADDSQAIACRFVFSSRAKLDEELAVVLARGSSIARKIAPTIRRTSALSL